jgi:hypothetical protein
MSGIGNAYDCKLRLADRLMMPPLMEHTGPGGAKLLFDELSLSAYHDAWDAYATLVVQDGATTGIAGSYRSGNTGAVWQRDRDQHTRSAINPEPIDFLCR